MPIKSAEKVYLRWEGINYYVPGMKPIDTVVKKVMSDISSSISRRNSQIEMPFGEIDADGVPT